ncbi:MAG: hypothetical protein Q8O89_00375 [Nanoarchaeota archaeon]|nr:hypothetical protein [Nanoarchaeota archaeon]
MQIIKIGKDKVLNKDIIKITYKGTEIPGLQLFNTSDVIVGNPNSNIAMAFAYTWKEDSAPKQIRQYMQRLSNYNYLTGLWRTTNGAKYVFSNILANPNVNKLVIIVFNHKDNGHLLAEALTKFWLNGINENGIIIDSKSPNPKFEQVPTDGLERMRKQCDLIVIRNVEENEKGLEKIEKIARACIQEPENSASPELLGIDYYSNYGMKKIYDDGARFSEPINIDLSGTARKVEYQHREITTAIGQSIQAQDLEEAHESIAAFIFENGHTLVDQRNIITIECRSISVTIMDALKKMPDGFSKNYIERYVDEFINGLGENLDEFVYTYNNRIFKKWDNQYEKNNRTFEKPSDNKTRIDILMGPKK